MVVEKLPRFLEERGLSKERQAKVMNLLKIMKTKGHDVDKLVEHILNLPDKPYFRNFPLAKLLTRVLGSDYYSSKIVLESLRSLRDKELDGKFGQEILSKLQDKHHEVRVDAVKELFWKKNQNELKKLGFSSRNDLDSWPVNFLFKLVEFTPNKFKIKGSKEEELMPFRLAVKHSDNLRDYLMSLEITRKTLNELKARGVNLNEWDKPGLLHRKVIKEDDKVKEVLEFRVWDRNPKTDLFLGESSGDCSSITGPQYWNRLPQLFDSSVSIIKIRKKTIDKKRRKEHSREIGVIYSLATEDRNEDPVLAIEAIELSKSIKPEPKIAEAVHEAILKYASKTNFKKVAIDSLVSGREWFRERFKSRFKEEPKLVELRKIGELNHEKAEKLGLDKLYYQIFVWHEKPRGHMITSVYLVSKDGSEVVSSPEIHPEKHFKHEEERYPSELKSEIGRMVLDGFDEGFRRGLSSSRRPVELAPPPPLAVRALDREHARIVRGIVRDVLEKYRRGEFPLHKIKEKVSNSVREVIMLTNKGIEENPPPKPPKNILPYINFVRPNPRKVTIRNVKEVLREFGFEP